ncbi:hypothetical protein KI387_025959, partial [Taxus chinensis]
LCQEMEKLSCTNRGLFMLTTNILVFFVSVLAQPGFLNIDCGGRNNSTDYETNMTWIVDANYIDVGQTAKVSMSNIPLHLQYLRFFPKPLKKSCYRLPVIPNVTYLLRLWFLSGNYDRAQKLPSFNVSFETQGMLTQKVQSITYAETIQWTSEKILVSPGGVLYVCLIRTSDDSDPFVSAIQLRSLLSGMYGLQVKPGTMLSSLSRHDIGSKSPDRIRYPQDQFDRFWSSDRDLTVDNSTLVRYGHSENIFGNKNSNSNFPPTIVMQTAIIGETTTEPLRIHLQREDSKTLVVLYFTEIEVLNTWESRKFKTMINEKNVCNVSFPVKNYSVEVPVTYNDTEVEVIVSLETIEDEQGKSSRGPLINALEYYRIIDSDPETDASDVDALLSIKRVFDMKNWTSDPCFSIAWDGISCNNSHTIRVTEINLSGRNLFGSVPKRINDMIELRSISFQDNHLSGFLPDLCNLARLQILRLQNNNISGVIPNCLSKLKNLKEVNLENNSFSGVIPEGLLHNRLLDLRYSGNLHLCKGKNQCHSNHNKVKIVVESTVGAVLAISLVLVAVIFYRHQRYLRNRNQMNQHANAGLTVMVPNPLSCRSFSLLEMKIATMNFSQKIGQGGFGSVYFGKLQDGNDVAVKLLSSSSKQGVAEFLNEINLLSRIHHKNLVSLLGYCNHSKELMLVYEYMCEGSLKDHLYGSPANSSTLDWKTRLGIALDAAEGLEYLHISCTPKIIHRDVKSSNILLDSKLRAKVADFGLSKLFGDEAVSSHVTTTIKGTVGYLDPEYFHTNKLTERSDVYSFGVVLLEIICGRKSVDPELSEEELSLLKWVMLHIQQDEDSDHQLTDIIDPKMSMSDNNIKSFHYILKLSMNCIQSEASKRPTISDVVAQIKDAMNIAEESIEPLCSTEYSYSLLDVGR